MIFSSIPAIGGLIRILELVGGPVIAPENSRASSHPFPIMLHILASFLFCIVGAVQFMPSIRRFYPKTHRIIGRIVVVAGGIAAASGLWMTHFFDFPEDLQGSLLYWVRMVLGTMMIGFIAWAIIAIKSRNIFQHSASMLRAYAIGQGASTQSILGISWHIFFKSEAIGPAREGLMVFAWFLNLLLAEILIRRFLSNKTQPVRPKNAT
jgi:hypothetical protein